MNFHLTQRTVVTWIGVVLTLATVLSLVTGHRLALFERMEHDLYDLRLVKNAEPDIDNRIVIVDVDEATMRAEGRWPWSRDKLALLLEQLYARYQVSLVGFDVVFPEADTDISQFTLRELHQQKPDLTLNELLYLSEQQYTDLSFADTIGHYGAVLGYAFDHHSENITPTGVLGAPVIEHSPELAKIGLPDASSYIGNLGVLQAATPWAGFFDNPAVDHDGVYRRVSLMQSYQGAYYPSLSLAMLMALFGENTVELNVEYDTTGEFAALSQVNLAGIPIPVDESGAVLVPFRGPAGSFPYISATDVLSGKADANVLDGAIVLVGTSAAGLLDLRVTPYGDLYPGVEVHANIISGVLDERILSKPDYTSAIELIQLLIVGITLAFLLPRLSVVWAAMLAVFFIVALVASNLYFWLAFKWVVPLAYTLLLTVVIYIFQQTSGYFFESRNRRHLASVFGQYIPPEIVSELNSEGTEAQLRGESRQMTVFFSDVRGFTSLSESLTPNQLTRLMNTYLTPMTCIVHDHRGTVDKYIGDALMAFWGAPINDPQHSEHAMQAALAMQAELSDVNAKLSEQGLPSIEIGMGLHSGTMSVGNMGSSFRMAYTVMGDAVNLGARLEGLTKFYGVPIIVSGELRDALPNFAFLELDIVRVKGREEPVTLYLPLGLRSQTQPNEFYMLETFERALRAYRKGEWEMASKHLQTFAQITHKLAKQDNYSTLVDLYDQRIQDCLVEFGKVAPESWDFIFSHTTK
ncbi:MAG: CHASE2 domain-containing protein [Pontibacterium sp.]